MVGSKIGHDLAALGVPILAQGDPGQLPPIKDEAYFMGGNPDVLLTEIHRQAKDSGILRLATDVREGRPYSKGSYGADCRVVRQGQDSNEALAVGADQVLVGRNNTRRRANFSLRASKGRTGPMPVLGDKLVCLQNNNDLDLMNGSQWVCQDPGRRGGMTLRQVGVVPLDADGLSLEVDMHAAIFEGGEVSRKDWRGAEHFDHGEAMTVHKSQGSQWDKVYIIDESSAFDRRWLYTGVTRAAKDLTLVVS